MSPSQQSKKVLLLPTAAPPSQSPSPPDSWYSTNTFESALFYICIAALLVLFGALYFRDALPPSNLLAPTIQLLHAGMVPSLWASLPAPALLFMSTPYFAEPAKVTMVRYWIYLLYIVGVAVGALVFGSEVGVVECEMAAMML